MSDDGKYNGYTNYETWAVKLWIDNDQPSQEYWLEGARISLTEAPDNGDPGTIFTREERATFDLADALKEWHEENTPSAFGVFADLLNASLGRVDWQEIATSLIADAAEIPA